MPTVHIYIYIFFIWGDGRHQVLSTVTRLSDARKMQATRVSVDTEDRRSSPGLGSSLAIDTGFCRASPSCASPEIAMKTWVSIDTRDRRPSPRSHLRFFSLSNLDLHMLVRIHSKNTYESNLKMKQKTIFTPSDCLPEALILTSLARLNHTCSCRGD